jgi:MAF protein
LAEEKAKVIALNIKNPQVIVAADTTVVDGNEILNKPTSPTEAMHMLQSLRGRVHQVITGIAVYSLADNHLITNWCVTDVLMREYTDSEIELYIETGDPLDKAGAYAIQSIGFNPVQSWQGCYSNVMGLPVCTLARMLEKAGVQTPSDTMQTCQTLLLGKDVVCRFAPLN